MSADTPHDDDDFEPPPPPSFDSADATPTETDLTDDIAGNSVSGLLGMGRETPLPDSLPVDIDDWQPPSPEHLHELLREAQIEVHSLIGRGGMGAVYKGLQIKLNRIVAIKILPPELARSEDFVGRFKREAQVLASLTNPGIVAIYDFGQTSESHLYFVMEYVEGTDLAKFIRAGKLTADLALNLTAQICDALQFAHEKGVIHRDIKPANVLVSHDGSRAKLADFGLAMRPTDPAEPIPDLPIPAGKHTPVRSLDPTGLRYTRTGHGMGTPPYAAPEVYAGVADERSDIFALGIMLYELLTGSPPEPRYILPSQKVGTTTALDDVVMKALEGEPDSRFQTANEMRQAVEQATQPLSSALTLTATPIQVIPPQSQALTTSHQSLRQQQALAAQRDAYRAKAQETNRRSWLSRLITLASLALFSAIAFDAGQHWKQAKQWLAIVADFVPNIALSPSESAPATSVPAAQLTAEQTSPKSLTSTNDAIPTDALSFQGRHFRLYRERLSWDDAKRRCETLGGRLAIVPNQPTWNAVRSLIDDKGTYWLGASDGTPKGSWKWLDGTPITFSFWMNRHTRADHGDFDNYLCIDNYWPGTVWRSLPNHGDQGSCHVIGFICEWLDATAQGKPEQVPVTSNTAAPPAARATEAASSQIDPLIGRWVFFNNSVRSFNLDGSSIDENGQTARWQRLDAAQQSQRYEVVYEGGLFTDYLTLTNGNFLEGRGKGGIHVTAHRLSSTITAQTTHADITREFEGIERLRAALLKYQWHYTDVGWPSSTVDFYRDGTFHSKWHWHYWILNPQEIHVQFWDGNFKPTQGDRFTFNPELTRFECPKSNGSARIVGTRL